MLDVSLCFVEFRPLHLEEFLEAAPALASFNQVLSGPRRTSRRGGDLFGLEGLAVSHTKELPVGTDFLRLPTHLLMKHVERVCQPTSQPVPQLYKGAAIQAFLAILREKGVGP